MSCISRTKANANPVHFVIIFCILLIIPSDVMTIFNNFFDTTNIAIGQPNQTISNITDSLCIQNIPVKKVHVDDIAIAYKDDW
jgi:hypothetical protein